MNFVCILASLVIAGIAGEKLSSMENEQIQQICGRHKNIEQKVMNGVKAEPTDAPWAVAIDVFRTDGLMHCTGTLVSSRHVITARHCFLNDFEKGSFTYVSDDRRIDYKNCEGKDFIVPRGSDKAEIHFSTKCRNEKACASINLSPDLVTRFTQRVILPGVCSEMSSEPMDHDDFAILELDGDVLFSGSIHPACIPMTSVGLERGTTLTTYGFGFDPDDHIVPTGVLRFESVIITYDKNCEFEKFFCSLSYTGKQLACKGDSGAGSVLEVNNRTMLIAVLSRGVECRKGLRNQADYLAPVVRYKSNICKYTGICETTTPRKDYDVSHLMPLDILEVPHCLVCLNNYDSTNRIPAALTCGHTMCRYCVEEISIRSRGSPICPVCRIEFSTDQTIRIYQLEECAKMVKGFIESKTDEKKHIGELEELVSLQKMNMDRLQDEVAFLNVKVEEAAEMLVDIKFDNKVQEILTNENTVYNGYEEVHAKARRWLEENDLSAKDIKLESPEMRTLRRDYLKNLKDNLRCPNEHGQMVPMSEYELSKIFNYVARMTYRQLLIYTCPDGMTEERSRLLAKFLNDFSHKMASISVVPNVEMPSCPVCQEEFESDRHAPMSLGCGHSVCDACVKQFLSRNEELCPMCRNLVNFRTSSKNYNLEEAISVIKKLREEPKKPPGPANPVECTVCAKIENESAMFVCRTCVSDVFKYDVLGTINPETELDVKTLALCGSCAIGGHVSLRHEIVQYFPISSGYQFESYFTAVNSSKNDLEEQVKRMQERWALHNSTVELFYKEVEIMTEMMMKAKSSDIQQEFAKRIGDEIEKMTNHVVKIASFIATQETEYQETFKNLLEVNDNDEKTKCSEFPEKKSEMQCNDCSAKKPLEKMYCCQECCEVVRALMGGLLDAVDAVDFETLPICAQCCIENHSGVAVGPHSVVKCADVLAKYESLIGQIRVDKRKTELNKKFAGLLETCQGYMNILKISQMGKIVMENREHPDHNFVVKTFQDTLEEADQVIQELQINAEVKRHLVEMKIGTLKAVEAVEEFEVSEA
ncbi:unnamed protein product [Caenorhabditis sp. 36 PRJEB53466]|nr:unnamed protein product [Caenorhabditis sp. 36 PRJEB53466]